MERYSARVIDELRRVVLPSEIRQKLGLEVTKPEVTLQPRGNIVIMQPMKQPMDDNYVTSKVDELGRIELSDKLIQKMGWKLEDKIAVYYVDDGMAILKLA